MNSTSEPAIRRIISTDGTALAVEEWGRPDGPAILFIHGGMQSRRCWRRQVNDAALASVFRLVTFDLRGHGESDKPSDEACYREARRWADDLASILSGLALDRPTIVPWSFGGRVLGDYMALHGPRNVGAINFVAARMDLGLSHIGPNVEALTRAVSADIPTMEGGIADFARLCFHVPPPAHELAEVIAYNMQVPAYVRRSMRDRPGSYDDTLKALGIPTLATHGAEDRVLLPSLSRHISATAPGCMLSIYPGVGHSPFQEEPERFNHELALLAHQAS